MKFRMKHRYWLPKPPKVMTAPIMPLIVVLTLHVFHLFSFKDSSSRSQSCFCRLSSLSGIFHLVSSRGNIQKYLTIVAPIRRQASHH